MSFTQFTLKNLLRRPVRTLLTIMGIGLGIGAVVALLGLAWGLEQSWAEGLRARKTDLVVRKSGGGLVAQPFDESAVAKIRNLPGVAAAAGLMGEVLSVEQVPLMVITGREWGTFIWDSLEVKAGRLPTGPDEKAVVLGTIAAETLGKRPGEKVTIEVEELEVVGIVDGKAVVENGGIVMALPLLQNLMQKPALITFINIRLQPDVGDPKVVAQKIEQELPGLKVEIAEDVFANSDSVKTFQAMNWGTSAVALLVGTFGVMNTMLMSVFERTREIGILLAVGWRRSRILRMVLWESIALCAVAGLLGILFGIGMLKALSMTPWIHGRLEPYVGWDLSGYAFAMAVLVGLASGLYPALRCTKINPSLAIRES
jgi:putative ABC transport system permease protein